MATSAQQGAPRLRADAARNRAKLVDAARQAFAETSDGNDVSMEAVAKRAGVGIGTLYRHFPTRLDLMEALYREDVDVLREEADRLSADREPWQALSEWLDLFLVFAARKRSIFTELIATVGRDSELLSYSRGVLSEVVTTLVGRAQEAGAAREDVTAGDVLSLVSGCTMMNLERDQSERVLRVVLDGLKA